MSNTRKLFRGALILTIAGMIGKFASVFFRIPLVDLLGDEGIGYYQKPLPIYTFIIAISFVGIPSVISKLVSEKLVDKKYAEAHQIFQISVAILTLIGIISSVIIWFGADIIIRMGSWSIDTKYSILALSISPIFISLMGAFRGYFHGMQNMKPTGVSYVFQELTRVTVGIGLTIILVNTYGIAEGAGGASLGATAGGFIGAVMLLIYYLRDRKNILDNVEESKAICEKVDFYHTTKRILALSVPIIIGCALFTLMNLADSFLIERRLKDIGIDVKTAEILYGQLSGKALTLINVPLTFSVALMASLVPAISEAISKKNQQELIDKIRLGTRFIIIIGLPASAGLYILSQPILTLIYRSNNGGAEILSMLSLSLVFLMLGQASTSILQGTGDLYKNVKNVMIALAIKIILNYLLVASSLQVLGATIASIIAYATYTVLNYRIILMKYQFRFKIYQDIIKPLISTAMMSIVVVIVYYSLNNKIGNLLSTLLAMSIGGIIYLITLFLTKSITSKDIKNIKYGNKIIKK